MLFTLKFKSLFIQISCFDTSVYHGIPTALEPPPAPGKTTAPVRAPATSRSVIEPAIECAVEQRCAPSWHYIPTFRISLIILLVSSLHLMLPFLVRHVLGTDPAAPAVIESDEGIAQWYAPACNYIGFLLILGLVRRLSSGAA